MIVRLLGINDVIGFHADNVVELRLALEEAVDDYLASSRDVTQWNRGNHWLKTSIPFYFIEATCCILLFFRLYELRFIIVLNIKN